jgi:NAD(P)H-flavin reductase
LANPSKVACRVAALRACGEGAYTVELEPKGRIPRFRAGQFLHLTVDEYDPAGGFWPESRVFSIASRYGAERITIVYSVKGRYTRFMEERLKPGADVWIKLPFGDFVIESRMSPGSDVVLVAGGTGVSPFIPFLEERFEAPDPSRRIRLYYGIRSPGHVLFGDLLTRCVNEGIIELSPWLESGAFDPASSPAFSAARSGRLSPDVVYEECAGLEAPVFFLSGPPAMINYFKSSLSSAGIAAERIQVDEWE